MNNQAVQKIYQQYVLPTYRQTPVCLVKGKGSRVWDIEGHEYLDFFPGWAVSGLGHCPPEVVHAIKNQARKILHVPNNFLNKKQAELARTIVEHAFSGKVFFCNSGTEATEAAIKFARKYGHDQGRYEIITMKRSFHGRTMAAIAATGQERIQKGFEPLLEGFRYAEFNDLPSVETLLSSKTVAIFVEPVLGEGGVQIATQEFMQGLRRLCDKHKLLLMLDEVQTGMGRTGKMFAYQHYGIEPDVMTMAKALGAGFPIGAILAHDRVSTDVLGPGTHGSTFGGSPLAAAASLAVFKTIQKRKLISHAVTMGNYLSEKLKNLKTKYSMIKETRALGLMQAIELNQSATPAAEAALKKGLIINCTQETVLRIIPAMTVTKKEIDRAVVILEEVLAEIERGK